MERQRRPLVLTRREYLFGAFGVTATSAAAAFGLLTERHTSPNTLTRPPTPPSESVPFASLKQRTRLSDTVRQAGSHKTVDFGAGTFWDRDFLDPANDPVYTMYFSTTSVAGAGVNATVFETVPESSTKARLVPVQSTNATNQFAVMRFDGAPAVRDFTVRGTVQPVDPHTGKPQTYNGIFLYACVGARLQDIRVKGIPGSAASNPGETFSVNDYRGSGSDFVRVEVDGTDNTGRRVAASGIGLNYTTAFNTVDCYSHGMAYGAGVTHYGATGPITHTRFRSLDNVIPFNFERCVSTVVMDSCVSQANRSRTADAAARPIFAVIDSDLGSSSVVIRNPVIDHGTPTPQNPVVVVIHPTYGGKPNLQRPEDIHLYLNGTERADCLAFARDETLPAE